MRDWLAPGHYRRGDRLPPEHELAGMLGISRGTLRSALRRLELTGEIVRRQGSGTFVGTLSSPLSFAEQRARISSVTTRARPELDVTISQVQIERGPAGARAAAALAIGARQRTVVITRAIAIEGEPAAITRDVFHPSVALPSDAELERLLATGIKVIEMMEATDIAIAFTRTTITPTLLGPDDPIGGQLALSGVTACLDVEEVVFAAEDAPLLYSRDVLTPGGMEIELIQAVDAPAPVPVALREGRRHRGTAEVQAARGARARS